MREEKVILKARFDPKLKTYWYIQGAILLTAMVITLPVLPFWLLGLGQIYSRRVYEHLQAELTERSLNLRMGYWFKTEKHIPLDKIQDLALKEGPILRKLGLASLAVETAGGSGQGGPDASLSGVVDAVAFRDAVLEQRERVTMGQQPRPTLRDDSASDPQLLAEIRDSLLRIEELLKEPGRGS